ncbi:MAG: gliding motility-associated transporter permease protein [Schlesneria sp.]|nr:gliding motility-associated transporter permease protein [Schlesneria sp.]
MQSVVAKFGLPLLARELTQLAARPRTFVLRTLYAVTLYAAALWFYSKWTGQFRPDSFEVLGQGKSLFEQLVNWQFWGLYLFLPVMTCGAIAVEKERMTLPLLKLTKLGGWTILLEKLGSRLAAIGSFLLLSLPLEAMAYGLGGVELSDVLKAVYVLTITAFQIGCFSLLCSAWSRTTVGATLGAYLVGAATFLLVPRMWHFALVSIVRFGSLDLAMANPDASDRYELAFSIRHVLNSYPLSGPGLLSCSMPDETFDSIAMTLASLEFADTDELDSALVALNTIQFSSVIGDATLRNVVTASIPMLMSGWILLALARVCLWRRAESNSSSWTRSMSIRLDQLFSSLDHLLPFLPRFSPIDLPINKPVAWRERRLRLVGKTRHIWRMILVFECPLVGLLAWQAISNPADFGELVTGLWKGLWFLAVLMVVMVSTRLAPNDRVRQTLDVLLAAPITSAEIASQKMSGLYRLIAIASVPLMTVLAFQAFADDDNIEFLAQGSGFFVNQFVLNMIKRSCAILFYLPLIGWLGFQFGLRLRNQFRAIMAVVLALVATCGLPKLLDWILSAPWFIEMPQLLLLAMIDWINPWSVVFEDDHNTWLLDGFITSDVLPMEWFPVLFHFLLVGGMLWGIRRNALLNFGRLVGRLEPTADRHAKSKSNQPATHFEFEIAEFRSANAGDDVDTNRLSPAPRE